MLCAALLAGLAWTTPAAAQATRREALEQRRAERATRLEPYEPGKIEAAMLRMERTQLLERWALGYDGWYPRIGSVSRGGGFSGGAGYRQHVWSSRLRFDGSAAIAAWR